jgi:hypothetical protein
LAYKVSTTSWSCWTFIETIDVEFFLEANWRPTLHRNKLEPGSRLETTSAVIYHWLVLPPLLPCQPNIKVIHQYNILQVASYEYKHERKICTYNSFLNIFNKTFLLATMHLLEKIYCTRFSILIFFLLLKWQNESCENGDLDIRYMLDLKISI